ncbi:MAG: O-antigen ligase family protein [Acidimicrobiales bacterium]|nr:O-antigen ligase family protein [Acidimicrobiales bacterium]
MQSSRSRIALVALGLLVTMNGPGFFVQFRVLDQPWDWDGPVVRDLFVALSVASVVTVVLARAAGTLGPLRRGGVVAVAGFSVWVAATSLWSVAPEITRGRSLIYVGLACFAVVIARMNAVDRTRALAAAVAVALVASLAAVLLSDSISLDRNDDWRGIFTNRNSLAPVAGVGILLGVGLAAERRGRARLAPLALAGLGGILMLGSGSRTAWLAVFAAAGAAVVVVATRVGRERIGARAIALGTATAAAGFAAVAVVVGLMWNEATFAQRRTIWRLVWDQIGERPIHGHGWFTMWTQPEFTSTHELLGRGSAHDSVMDAWLGAGVIGAALFVAVVVLAVGNTARDAWRTPNAATATWLALIVFLVIENITESFVLWYSYNWVLLMAAALCVGPRPRRGGDRETHRASEPATV